MIEKIERRKALAGMIASSLFIRPGRDNQDSQAVTGPASIPADKSQPIDVQAALKGLSDVLASSKRPRTNRTISPGAGELPIPRDDAAWKAIVDHMLNAYDLPKSLSDPLPRKLLPIDAGFAYSAKATDVNFRWWHVEPLLNQTADLLDRAIRDREDWNVNAVRGFEVMVDLIEYYGIDKIHIDETKAGYYTLSSKESSADFNAEQAVATLSDYSATLLDIIVNQYFTPNRIQSQSGFAQLASWVSKFATYSSDHHPPLLSATWDGVTKEIPTHLHDAATGQSYHNLYTEYFTYASELAARRTTAGAASDRLPGRQARADWDLQDVDFRRRRTQVARDLADLKTKAFTDAAGVLNSPERMIPIQQRFQRDFRDALARIFPAFDGLVKLYGYEETLPSSLQEAKNGKTPTDNHFFDDCLVWVRDAIAWLVGFSQLEQNYVLAVSLRNLMTAESWKTGTESGSWSFAIDEKLFADEVHVRLRGLSAFVVGADADDGVWDLRFGVPTQSFCRHLSNKTVQLDQTSIPRCRLGRVTPREHPRSPDAVGIATLHNTSPFGNWKVSALPRSTTGKKITELKDIVVDLHLAVRSKT